MEYHVNHSDTGTFYYKKGTFLLHRKEGPAAIYNNGTEEWWVNGFRHRVDGPAITFPDGEMQWYINGELHRIDGPARIFANGTKGWFFNGVLHRTDGPAIEWNDDTFSWYIDGERLSDEKEMILNKWWKNKNDSSCR